MSENLLTRKQVIGILRSEIAKVGTHEKFAAENYFSTPTVSQTLSGRVRPGPAILDALGLEKVIRYRAKI